MLRLLKQIYITYGDYLGFVIKIELILKTFAIFLIKITYFKIAR